MSAASTSLQRHCPSRPRPGPSWHSNSCPCCHPPTHLSRASAAFSTSSLVPSKATRCLARTSLRPPCAARGRPKADRCRERDAASCRARSAMPTRRMQWCSRPGPSRPCRRSSSSRGYGRAALVMTGVTTQVTPLHFMQAGCQLVVHLLLLLLLLLLPLLLLLLPPRWCTAAAPGSRQTSTSPP